MLKRNSAFSTVWERRCKNLVSRRKITQSTKILRYVVSFNSFYIKTNPAFFLNQSKLKIYCFSSWNNKKKLARFCLRAKQMCLNLRATVSLVGQLARSTFLNNNRATFPKLVTIRFTWTMEVTVKKWSIINHSTPMIQTWACSVVSVPAFTT